MLIAYLRERFPAWLFTPLAAALCAAAFAGSRWPTAGQTVLTGVFAVLLLLQFRLWDDLADLPADCKNHPERVLPRARSLRPFWTAIWALTGVCAGLAAALDPSGRKLASLAGLDLVFFLWYQSRPKEFMLGYHVVLLKYPLFIYLLAPRGTAPGFASRLFAMVLVYLAACVFEVLHDARLRKVWAARRAFAIEVALLGGAGIAALFLGAKS